MENMKENIIGKDLAYKIINDFVQDQIIEKYDLDYGNAEVSAEDSFFSIEAPNNTTIWVHCDEIIDWLSSTEISEVLVSHNGNIDTENPELNDDFASELEYELIKEMREAIDNFDVDETFIEIWSRDFEVGPSTFLHWLEEDQEFFDNIVYPN